MDWDWKGHVWIVSAAVILGALVVALMSGAPIQWPLLVGPLLVAVTLTGAVSTVLARQRRRRRTLDRHFPGDSRSERNATRTEAADAGITLEDWEELSRVCGAIGRLDIHWLRSTSFVTPWLDAKARAALDLGPRIEALRGRPFPAHVCLAIGRFGDALAAFDEPYTAETFPDPLLLGTDWRFFDWDHPEAFESTTAGRELWQGRATRMEYLAAAVADAYDALVETALAQPQVRKLVAARA
jgi:hypothetical protein